MFSKQALLWGFLLLASSILHAEDWPQWQGVRRDSVWNESGLIEKFPTDGAKVLWRMPLRYGYAGPAVAGDKVYAIDFDTKEESIEKLGFQKKAIPGSERIFCFDSAKGTVIWKFEYPVTYDIQYPAGPRCTPTVHDGMVYTLGAMGDLFCLNAADGKVVWSKNFVKDFAAEVPVWGYAGHPLVVGELLIVQPGGEKGCALALDRKTGAEKWRAVPNIDPGYAPPSLIKHGGKDLLLIWETMNLNALDPATGNVYWSLPIVVDYKMPVMAPRVTGDLLYASGVEQTAALVKLGGTANPTAEIVWRAKPKTAQFTVNSSPFVHEGHIYGANVDGEFLCAKLDTAERLWTDYAPTTGKKHGGKADRSGTCFVVKNGDRFILFSETGDLIFANLTPEKYEELSRASIIKPSGTAWNRPLVWSHPAFANKCVFARNDQEIVCVSLAKE
jgi:outer membrane protein assembly factor BamB